MSKYEDKYILQYDVFEPYTPMWLALHQFFRLIPRYVNPPFFYTGILHAASAGASFSHFSVDFVIAGHYRADGTWWDLFAEKQRPSGIQLRMRAYYHEEVPTRENIKPQSLVSPPKSLYIEEVRLGYTPNMLLGILGIEHIPPESRMKAMSNILPGLKLFHPDTMEALFKPLRGGSQSPYDFSRLPEYYEEGKELFKIAKEVYATLNHLDDDASKREIISKATKGKIDSDLIVRMMKGEPYISTNSQLAAEYAARKCGIPADRTDGSYPPTYILQLITKQKNN